MPQYTVYFTTGEEISVKVEAEDDDAAIDLAYEQKPESLCTACSGWGQNWYRNAEGHEATAVADADGEIVWQQDSQLEIAQKEISRLKAELDQLKSGGA